MKGVPLLQYEILLHAVSSNIIPNYWGFTFLVFFFCCNHLLMITFYLSLEQEEFLKDVMQFLILRGHSRLIPQGGLAEFPDAILNGKRLDLYNLYKEVN